MITGCGVVSPLGSGVRAFFEGLVAGRSAVGPISGFDAAGLSPSVAAEVREPSITDPDRAGAFVLRAAREALRDAGLEGALPPRLGVVLGTTLGGMRLFEVWNGGRAADVDLERIPYFAPAVRVARALGCHGPVATTQLACASSTHAIALAADWIRRGRADAVLAGGTDLLCRFVVAGFNCLRATADTARPFDRDRRGLVLGEGAAVVVVEDAAHAARRRARLHGRLLGVGSAADAVHMTAPDRDGGGAARAIQAALDDAGLAPEAIDFVSARVGNYQRHPVFGERRVPVNSIKGAVGHTLGAAGAFEVVMCLAAMAEGVVPPTAGLVNVDPACAALDLVFGARRRGELERAVSTSSGFAGTNAALVLGRA